MKTGTIDLVSNEATLQVNLDILDADDGTPFNLSGVDQITVKLRDPDSGSAVLEGSLSGGEVIVVGDEADGVIQFTFSATSMSDIEPKTYEIGVLITDEDGFVSQVILGRLPVGWGL